MSEAGQNGVNKQVEKKAETKQQVIFEWVRDIVIAILIAIAISMVIKPTVVKETSMEPNFYSNDYIFLSRLAYKFGREPKKGDVIVFRSHSDDLLDKNGKNKLLIKRVIAVPDDTISISNGEVYVNGEEDDQSFTKDGETNGEIPEVKVPEGKVFCMGDNRFVSVDSRSKDVGFVDQDTIVGKAVFRLLPLGSMGMIKNVYDTGKKN